MPAPFRILKPAAMSVTVQETTAAVESAGGVAAATGLNVTAATQPSSGNGFQAR